jgi:hypothetical protein
MNDLKSGIIVPEEDEFKGLGDDLLCDVPPQAPATEAVKIPRAKKTIRQKAIRIMLKRSGLGRIPPLEQIFAGKTGPQMPISEIGFISKSKQTDPLLALLAAECPERNRLNRDDILRSRILAVGTEIFKAERMWTPIHVFHDPSTGGTECISGRHRLAFLALTYGPSIKIPVYIENLTLKAAREATAVANDSRPVKALERASYAILRAAGGNTEADKDILYERMAAHKPDIGKYCVYSVIERGYPEKLTFRVSEKSSRPDGGITTVSNVEEFWGEALPRRKGMGRKEFDAGLAESVRFLNALMARIGGLSGFDPDQHLTANVMSAIGRYYQTFQTIARRNAIEIVGPLAEGVVKLGQTSKRPLAELCNAVAGCVVNTLDGDEAREA